MYSISKQMFQITYEEAQQAHTATDLYGLTSHNYEACPESKDTKVLNMCNIFNLQKWYCEWIACT